MSKSQAGQSEAVLGDTPVVKISKSEGIFNGIAMSALAIYVVFIVIIIGSVVFYTSPKLLLKGIIAPTTLFSIRLSLWTSVLTTILAILMSIPAGYILSRYNFRGKAIVDVLLDLPITLPPLIIGMCLLVFFSTAAGQFVQEHIMTFVFSVPGIVLAQFTISASFALYALREAYDAVDPRYEDAARTLGCNKVQAFFKVTLPLIKPGIISGAVMTWTRAVGEFVPILLVCGASQGRTDILPIAIFLQFEQGDIEMAVSLTIIFLVLSAVYLSMFKKLGLKAGGLKKE
ncbi:MAG: ABC transporter permease subunit [Desulfobacteraceae bacterium]|jgi:molybdate transport system permease protein